MSVERRSAVITTSPTFEALDGGGSAAKACPPAPSAMTIPATDALVSQADLQIAEWFDTPRPLCCGEYWSYWSLFDSGLERQQLTFGAALPQQIVTAQGAGGILLPAIQAEGPSSAIDCSRLATMRGRASRDLA
jgi:hypothetical protein